jgi:hypothetical protein
MADKKASDNQVESDRSIPALQNSQKPKIAKNINHLYSPYLILLISGSIGIFTTFKLKVKSEV